MVGDTGARRSGDDYMGTRLEGDGKLESVID